MVLPHAYVVEYRVVDQCTVPDCRIDGRRTFGRLSADARQVGVAPGEAAAGGAYVVVGTDKNELFAKRGLSIPPSKELSFTLPPRAEASVLDMSLAAMPPAFGQFRAVLEVTSGGAIMAKKAWEGTSAPFEATTDPLRLGDEEKYFLHVREELPPRRQPLLVTLRNDGPTPLGVGAPVVLRRVEGRGPRQAFLVFFDAVPYPIFEEFYRTRSDKTSRFISSWVAEGTLFTQAISPGQLTGSFVRRFFRADYFGLDGDLSLAGQGFDDTPPERAPGPVARLAEQGFATYAMASNLYLSPILSGIGFDSDYNIESTKELQIHPEVLARRFARVMETHDADDAVFVIWYANTHFPWLEGRRDAPPFRFRGAREEALDRDVLEPIWKNLFDSMESLRGVVQTAKRRSPDGQRVFIVSADHGHTFTLPARARSWRLTGEAVERGHMHCCLSTEQEARTPLVIIAENGARSSGEKGTIDEPISTLAAFRELERRFGVNLELPTTSAFALPGEASGFNDGIVVSVGNSGSLFGRHGRLSYRSYQPAMNLVSAWDVSPKVALLLRGTPEPAGDIPSEELYEPARDPLETNNLAAERFDDLVEMRTRMASFLAEYGDGPEHERYEYVLAFERPTLVHLTAPRSFIFGADDEAPKQVAGRITVQATTLRLRDGEKPLGVLDLEGDEGLPKLLVRCGTSGLPLSYLDAEHQRLNLALARNNCIGASSPGGARPSIGEISFRAELVERRRGNAGGASVIPELKNALERWGYVREK